MQALQCAHTICYVLLQGYLVPMPRMQVLQWNMEGTVSRNLDARLDYLCRG
jgi:hypothetical protein